jgi:hypothetical protein
MRLPLSADRGVLYLLNRIFFYLKKPLHTEYKEKTTGKMMNSLAE